MKKVLLYSGGMDSWLIDKIWKPDVRIYVDMNSKYSNAEISRLNSNVNFVNFDLSKYEREDSIIPLRNLYLLMIACNETFNEDIEICIGATAGDRSLDQNLEFFEKAEEILNLLYKPQHWIPEGKKIKIITEFKQYTKAQLLQIYLNNGGDINLAFKESFSCYCGKTKECWNCKPCFRKFIAFAYCGYNFDKEVVDKNINYYNKYIKSELENKKVYRTPQDDFEVKEVIKKYVWSK